MSVQRKAGPDGKVRYRARVKSNGREVASRMFDRRSDAVAWEQDQRRRLRTGEWLDPRRGQAPLAALAEMWLQTRQTVKRRTLESDLGVCGTTSRHGSGDGRSPRSRPLRCQHGSVTC